jgi:tRNA pseudouridine38-40 synthase
MRQASRHLVGEHDFRSFCTSTSAPLSKNTVREINIIDIAEEDIRGEKLIVIRVVGTAFLHSMVRIIAGTLCDIGVGKHSPDDILDMLAAKDRRAAGQTAPAAGLSFFHVDYPQQVFVSE